MKTKNKNRKRKQLSKKDYREIARIRKSNMTLAQSIEVRHELS